MNTVIYAKNEKVESLEKFRDKTKLNVLEEKVYDNTRTNEFEDYRDNQKPGEIWKLIHEYETIYVSNYGRVRNGEKIIKGFARGNEYAVAFYNDGKTYVKYLKRLIAYAYIPNTYNDYYIRRYNNDPRDNRVSNLFYTCTFDSCKIDYPYPDEVWKIINNKYLRDVEISNYGRFRRNDIELKPIKDIDGYHIVFKYLKNEYDFKVKDLVVKVFIPNVHPKGVTYLNGNKYDNRVSNLYYYPDEKWKDVPNTKYEISNYGRIRNGDSYLSGTIDTRDNKKYLNILMNNGKQLRTSIHKLVATAFVPNPNNYSMILHINGNVQDNRAENLMWFDNHSNNTGQLMIRKFSKYPDEIWKEVPDYPGYYVSNYGQVVSAKRNKLLSNSPDKDGYYRAGMTNSNGNKTFKVHRLVAMLFVPIPEGLGTMNELVINHKNEIKTDNRASNLEWCTVEYNNNYGNRLERAIKHMTETKRKQFAEMSYEERKGYASHLHTDEINEKRKEVLQDKYENMNPEEQKYTFRNKIFGKVSNMDEQKQKECIEFIYNYYFMNLLCANNFNFATLFNSDLTQEYLPNNNYFYLYKDENDFANIGVHKD